MNTEIANPVLSFFSNYPHKKLAEGELLIAPGAPIKDIYLLLSGHVREYIVSEQGVELTIHIYERGATFPLFSLVRGYENEHYYDALTPLEVHAAPVSDFVAFLKANPEVMYDSMERLLLGLRGLVKRVEYLTLNKAYARLAASLLYLARHFGSQEGHSVSFTHRFTHHEIASIVGLARETVSLELERMMSEGLIAYNGRFIIIPDIRKLQQILEV